MTLRLESQDKARLDKASHLGVLGYATDLFSHFTNNNWLDTENVYRADAGRQVTKDKKKELATNSDDLGQYIAASVPLHLVDAWSYSGQALYAQVCGLPEVALHLGYYAETRATMSLLASQGIGVFARHHCVVEASGNIVFLPVEQIHGTHVAIWAYLDHWLKSRDASAILGEVIRPYTVPLEEWIQKLPCTTGGNWNRVAANLVHGFGLDLERLAKDRGLRNRASYDPSELLGFHRPDNSETVEFVLNTVQTLEPSGVGAGFGILDQQLLGHAIDQQFEASTGKKPLEDFDRYRNVIDTMLANVSSEQSVGVITRQFLIDERYRSGRQSLVQRASISEDNGDPRPLLSRAAVLLRVATGTAQVFMRVSNIKLDISGSWWEERARGIGLWNDGERPEEMIDIWADVDIALEELESWYQNGGRQTRDLFTKKAFELWEITNVGRLALIGFS